MQISLMSESNKLEFTSRAGSQVVRKMCVVIFALPRRGLSGLGCFPEKPWGCPKKTDKGALSEIHLAFPAVLC